MTEKVEVKQVALTDIDALLNLSRQTFFDAFAHLNNPDDIEAYAAQAFTKQKFEQELRHPDSRFYFAVVDDTVAGYIKLNYATAQTELQDPASLEIERIYVLNGYQGKQIGKHLIDFAIDTAIRQKLSYVWLGVWEHNNKVISFYKSRGFEQFGSHPFLLGNDEQTDILMRRPTQPSPEGRA